MAKMNIGGHDSLAIGQEKLHPAGVVGIFSCFSHSDCFRQSVHDCKNGPANFPLFDTIDVRDIDEAQFADSTLG